MDKYRLSYDRAIQCTRGPEMSSNYDGPRLEPPVLKRTPGRPTKNRKKSVGEVKKRAHAKFAWLGKEGAQITCTTCGIRGHNQRTCTSRSNQGEGANPTEVPDDGASNGRASSTAGGGSRPAPTSSRGRGTRAALTSGRGRGTRVAPTRGRGRGRGRGRTAPSNMHDADNGPTNVPSTAPHESDDNIETIDLTEETADTSSRGEGNKAAPSGSFPQNTPRAQSWRRTLRAMQRATKKRLPKPRNVAAASTRKRKVPC